MSNLSLATSAGAPDNSPPNVVQLRDVIGRLVTTIEEENFILGNQRELSLDSIIYKKSQLLLELMRAQRGCSPEFLKANLEKDIRKFKALMDINQQLLSVHLAAAREVSNTILDVLRQNESDGTYGSSKSIGRGIQ
jgi:flagellar biosynthesis/type III secretory pathway chaperone